MERTIKQNLGTMNYDESVDSSGDGVAEVRVDDGDNSFSFYEVWNHEMHMLKCAIDQRIQTITERSQKEIERIATTVTGVATPVPYKIKTIGPKIPPKQWTAHRAMMKQQYQQQQQQQQELQRIQQDKFGPMISIEPRMDGKTNNKSTKHRDLRISPSGRSQTTATSDKTIPQSNLSSRPKQPHTIINVLSIPEEASLQPTTEEENEIDILEETNDDDDDVEEEEEEEEANSESSRSSSRSHSSSIPDVPMEVISPVVLEPPSRFNTPTRKEVIVDEESDHEKEQSERIHIQHQHEDKTTDALDDTALDIPAMIASMSISSASRSEAGSSPAAIEPVLAAVPPKQSPRERQVSEERRQPRFYPWQVDRIQSTHGQRDAPTAPANGNFRPDAPASSVVRKDNMTVSNSPGMPVHEANIATGSIGVTEEAGKVLAQEYASPQKIDEALTSLPSIEETLPSITDNEIAAILRTETDSKTLDDDDLTNQSSKKGNQQHRKHRKPPSPETFIMSGNRKLKRNKVSNSPTKSVNKVEKYTETQMSTLDSIEESTIDTMTKIDDKETITEAPSTDIVPFNSEVRMQPHKCSVEPSLVRLEYVTEKKIKDPYNDEGIYTGILILGKPETHGTMKYEDGRYYTGSWKRGRWNGHGKAIFANGDTYTGDYVHDQRHGVGRYEWSDARVYDGRFEKDQREGHGTYSWPNGSVYCGEFHLGLRHGYGTYTYEDGSVYSGEWRNGRQNGNGECIWADGRCFRGDWVDGRTHTGVETRADGTIRRDGGRRKNRLGRPKVHQDKKQNKVQNQSQEIRLRKSFDSDQSAKPSLEYLRQGRSLVMSGTDTTGTMDESLKSKAGVLGIVSTSMSE